MLKDFLDLPPSLRYRTGSEHEPIQFFSEALCSSTSFKLMLGFFSSSAISLLSYGFSVFLFNEGHMKLLINTAITDEDKEAFKGKESSFFCSSGFDLRDIKKLSATLSKRDKHFFECLSFLIAKKRIELKVLRPNNRNGISHSKCGIFSDGTNKIAFEGSCNFTRYAMLENIESLSVFPSWEGSELKRIQAIEEDFERTFQGKDPSVVTMDANELEESILEYFPPKELKELLKQEIEFEAQSENSLPPNVKRSLQKARKTLVKLESEPRFPFISGPRDYQIEAFKNWKANRQKGLFEMATGTGKTITALNILLEVYKKEGSYKAIILVPTKTLAEQWEKECRAFNFQHVIQVSDNPNWRNELETNKMLSAYEVAGLESSFIVICLYRSFGTEDKFRELISFPKNDLSRLLFVADEAHCLGAKNLILKLPRIPFARRLGLSATPERQFQESVTKQLLEFFGALDHPTYEYSMKKAIEDGILCPYVYYPRIVTLTAEELEKYKEISKKISRLWNISTKLDFEGLSGNSALDMLLLQRKRILHKAHNKLQVFKEIIREVFNAQGSLKYTLVYVPEGYSDENESSQHLIDEFTRAIRELDKGIIVCQFTGETKNRDEIIKRFADGSINVLTSMKCLDEGIDVPQAKNAIFCASTGNPRQYIQRRGRILRKCKGKRLATIYDLLVDPGSLEGEDADIERRLVESELRRVFEFASLAENRNSILVTLVPLLERYNIQMDIKNE